ncbi:hypothetical protein [Chitinophaga sancti]|uniref:hypothetical protein n=1 Tax=Chitinophaga sancti TaxID=1004 RepID=UPI003F7A478B
MTDLLLNLTLLLLFQVIVEVTRKSNTFSFGNFGWCPELNHPQEGSADFHTDINHYY